MDIPWDELTGSEQLRTARYHELSVAERSAFDLHMEGRRRISRAIAGDVAASAPNQPAAAPAPRQRPAAPRAAVQSPTDVARAEGEEEARTVALGIIAACNRYGRLDLMASLVGSCQTVAAAERAIIEQLWVKSFAVARSQWR